MLSNSAIRVRIPLWPHLFFNINNLRFYINICGYGFYIMLLLYYNVIIILFCMGPLDSEYDFSRVYVLTWWLWPQYYICHWFGARNTVLGLGFPETRVRVRFRVRFRVLINLDSYNLFHLTIFPRPKNTFSSVTVTIRSQYMYLGHSRAQSRRASRACAYDSRVSSVNGDCLGERHAV